MRLPRFAVLALGLAVLALPTPAQTGSSGAVNSAGQIQHVAQVGYNGGSDLEFATKRVVKLSEGATGDPVCVLSTTGECQKDELGNVVFEMEDRDFAFAGRLSANVKVIDITDPRAPVEVAEVPCRLNQNDVQISGDTLVMAADAVGPCNRHSGGVLQVKGFATADISDPRNPKVLAKADESLGAHTLTVHPKQPLVFVSNGDISANASIHIWDISNPATPVKVKNWAPTAAGEPPHDITFNTAGTRAYAATQDLSTNILDTTDPRNPTLIAVIPNEGVSYSHQADPTPDGKYLFISDELGGGAADTPSPGGPIHVYDLTVEARPVKVGVIGTDATGMNGVSTSHVFRINPDGKSMAIAWYEDGVQVWDIANPVGANIAGSGATAGAGPRTIGWLRMPGANTWAAKMWQERHPGYVFANDINRGFDVFYVPPLGPPAPPAG